MEGQAKDLRAKVDCVALEIAFGPAPVAVLDDEAGILAHEEVAAAELDQDQAALFEQRRQRREPGGAGGVGGLVRMEQGGLDVTNFAGIVGIDAIGVVGILG